MGGDGGAAVALVVYMLLYLIKVNEESILNYNAPILVSLFFFVPMVVFWYGGG